MLTKSDFLIYLETPMHLWAKANNRQDSREFSAYDQHLARQGYQVEKLAKQFLNEYVQQNYTQAQLTFEDTIKVGSYQSRIDALVYDQENEVYDLYEIKSSTSIRSEHKHDVTFQYLVGKASELPVRDIYLVHVDTDYERNGEVDIHDLFVVDNMQEIVGKYEDKVFKGRAEALEVLRSSEPDGISICHKPHTCPSLSVCHPDLPEFAIYDLNRGSRKKYDQLKELGVETVDQIPDDFRLTYKQQLQVESAKSDQPVFDHDAIRHELQSLQYPLYFLDYETFGPAVPMFDGYTPYQPITFQYSLHILRHPEDEELEHHEFLFTETGDPSLTLSEHLLERMGESGSIIVWNKSFECGRNEELARLQPQFVHRFENLNERTYDLMDIFAQGLYVDYHFHGSASIKKVLPVLVPELSYEGMDIGEGATAMTKWFEMVYGGEDGEKLDEGEKQKIADNLLKYCELDTWAMVEIWRKLRLLFS